MRINLIRILETAGLDFADRGAAEDVGLWDVTSEVPSEELAEAIEAALTRATPLPGTQRFTMDKSDERQLLDPMVRARQELQLGILACEAAVGTILYVMDRIRDGVRDAGSVSLRSVIPSRLDHAETAAVFSAAEDLKSWQANGRVLDGKQRRGALAALEALDLSLAFHKELVRSLEQDPASVEHARRLSSQISRFEAATERLVREHLPFVRRFASRNVEDGEDPEDVFQVAFMGTQNATRRFDPALGYRFRIYATYWMRQAVTRWRADEGSAVRIPVHRHETLAKLAKSMDRLDVRADGIIPERMLAKELDWSIDEVRQLRRIPRHAEYREYLDEWDDLGVETNAEDEFDRKQANTVLAAALAELPDREARVIRMRFGIGRDDAMTLEEIGQLDGVTRERIRQIEAKGLKRLQHPARLSRLRVLLGM
jgi:RNA polymerase primary sigma factor